jgi:hypothetical protein
MFRGCKSDASGGRVSGLQRGRLQRPHDENIKARRDCASESDMLLQYRDVLRLIIDRLQYLRSYRHDTTP